MQNIEEIKENNINSNSSKVNKEDELLIISSNLNILSNNVNQENHDVPPPRDIGTDTDDLILENTFDFETLKKNYINNMISWSFLKKLSEMNQWPLGCLGNIIENSFKEEVNSKIIFFDVKAYSKYVYAGVEKNYLEKTTENFLKKKYSKWEGISLDQVTNFSDKILVLSIKDDGKGISSYEFNKMIYSFSVNENKEFNFFKFGISLKTSAIRLANSFLIISKTDSEVSIGLLSKSLQNKLDSDFIFTPIVNYLYDNNLNYIAKSNLSQQSLNFIISEIKFMFFDQDEIFNYIARMKTGTQIFLYDLKQISANKENINELKNYELYFDYNNNDIYYNFFDIHIGERSFIDCSLKNYLKFLFLQNKGKCDFYLFGNKVDLINPLKIIFELFKEKNKLNNSYEIECIKHNLRYEGKKVDGFFINNDIYRGVLLNEVLFNKIKEENENIFASLRENVSKVNEEENYFNEENYFSLVFNGVLLYSNNRLISRCKQYKFGEIQYFVKKFDDFYAKKKNKKTKYLFPITGFVELPSSNYELMYNKTEFKDQGLLGYFQSKLIGLIGKLEE